MDKEKVFKLIHNLESLRIDVEAETAYCDPTGVLARAYERANDMLDDCISEVREFYKDDIEQVDEYEPKVIFLSQAMSGVPEDEVQRSTTNLVIEELKKRHGENIQVISTYNRTDAPDKLDELEENLIQLRDEVVF